MSEAKIEDMAAARARLCLCDCQFHGSLKQTGLAVVRLFAPRSAVRAERTQSKHLIRLPTQSLSMGGLQFCFSNAKKACSQCH